MSKNVYTSNRNRSLSHRAPARSNGRGGGLERIQEGVSSMGLNDGVNDFLAGTPSKRRNRTPLASSDARANRSERATTKGQFDDRSRSYTRSTRENDDPFAKNNKNPLTTKSMVNSEVFIMTNGDLLTEEEIEQIEDLGGVLIPYDNKNPSSVKAVTVFVVDATSSDSIDPHTTPFLHAMTSGQLIVSLRWLKKSLHYKEFLPVDKYLLMNHENAAYCDISAKICDTHLSLSDAIATGIKEKAKGGILAGYVVTLCPGIDEENEYVASNELKVLLTAAGAKVLSKKGVEETDGIDADNLLVVTSAPATDAQKEYAKEFDGGRRVTSMLMIQILLQQSLVPLEKIIQIQKERAAEMMENDDSIVLFETKLLGVERTLSSKKGDPNRGQLGEGGTLQVVELGQIKYVYYFDREGSRKFKAQVPPKSTAEKEMFGNAGEQDCLVWEAKNEAIELHRRFFFLFGSRPQMDTFLVTLFGIEADPLTKQSILEEWYDKNGRFFTKGYTRPAHEIVMDEDEMEDVVPHPVFGKPRTALVCEYGSDALGPSQRF